MQKATNPQYTKILGWVRVWVIKYTFRIPYKAVPQIHFVQTFNLEKPANPLGTIPNWYYFNIGAGAPKWVGTFLQIWDTIT